MSGKIVIVFGPSGAGVSTLTQEVRTRIPSLYFSVSATTRAPRVGEADGVDYYFLTEAEFNYKVSQSLFLEWVTVHGYKYGTLVSEVEKRLADGTNILFDITVESSQEILSAWWKKRIEPDEAISIFVFPPYSDLEDLQKTLERRLSRCGLQTEEIQMRLKAVERQMEIGLNGLVLPVHNREGRTKEAAAEIVEHLRTKDIC